MNNKTSLKISGIIEMLIESSNRINQGKPEKYWYPLSMATYGVEEVVEAVDSMCSFRTTMWEKTRSFERLFSQYQGCRDSVMVNSGSSADMLLCFLMKEHISGDRNELLIPAVTWPTQIWSAMMAGFKVVLVDANPKTLNIDLDDLESKITSKTCGIFAVHVMGNPCNMERMSEIADRNGLFIIEDCCEAMGARFGGKNVGSFGCGGTYSFFFSHHITTMEGGIVVCPDDNLADELRIMRAHGWTRNSTMYSGSEHPGIDPRYAFVNWGFNMRPTELQAGFGLKQLEKLPMFNIRRDEFAGMFFDFAKKSEWIRIPEVDVQAVPSWLGLPMMVAENAPFSVSDLTRHLESSGVETRPVITGNVVKHVAAAKFGLLGFFPGADKIHSNGLYVGLSPMQTAENMHRLIACFEHFLGNF